MKKICLLIGLFLISFTTFSTSKVNAISLHNEYVVNTYSELASAVSKANNVSMTHITLNGEIILEKDLTVKGLITLNGTDNSKIIFENNGSKTGISISRNADITMNNLTIKRTVIDETEKFLIYTYEFATIRFNECIFDVASYETPSLSYDRVTYCSTVDALVLYFNNCQYNTDAYFYRGLMIFYNNEHLPSNIGGKATVKNFNDFKIDYETGRFTFPSNITVAEDEDFTKVIKSGASFASNKTYYILKEDFVFTYTTKDLKAETPTIASVDVDFSNEVINFTDEYLVSLNRDFTQLLTSGDKINPGQTLYIKQLAQGIFLESDVAEITLPQRPKAVELEVDFVCSFGFVMQYYENCEFMIFEEYQLSPVFIDLESDTTYKVHMRIKATTSNFASDVYSIDVKTSK